MNKRYLTYGLALGAAILTFVVYLPALWNGYVNWDDNTYVIENVHIRSLNASFFRWAFFDFHAANWHPLTWFSHALDYALWGLNPLGHHLTSIVIHALNTFLVVLLAGQLLAIWRERQERSKAVAFLDNRGALIAAGATGLLFGLHPLHVESVAWVSERKDLLCGLFFLSSIIAYVHSADAADDEEEQGSWTGRFLRRGYLLSLTLFALALMSKPMAVSLPLVLLILDGYPLGRIRSRLTFRSALIEKLPFIVLTLLSAIVTVLAQREALWTVAPPMAIRLLVASKALISYLLMMAAPVHLLPLYPYARNVSYYLTLEYAIAVVLVLWMTMISIRALRREKLWFSAWSYYVVTLLPVLGIIQVGSQSMADRYTYLPSFAPFFVSGLGAAWVWARTGAFKRGWRILLPVVAACLVMLLSALTVVQTRYWKSSIILWSSVIEREPDRVPVAYYNRAVAFKAAGDHDRAVSDFTAALSIRPSYIDALVGRGMLFREMGRLETAIDDFTAAIMLKPTLYFTYMHRGLALKELGRYDESLADYTTAVSLNPYAPAAYAERGRVFAEAGQPRRAVDDLTTALELDPDLVQAYVERGRLYQIIGDGNRAADDYQNACRRGSRAGCEALPVREGLRNGHEGKRHE